jgi:hypothetical protein
MNSETTAQWPCEQNVVDSVVSYLKREGWTIESVADTETRAPGADIRAAQSGKLLIVEAKGYPATVYARAQNKGKPKPTKPGVQARHWWTGAVRCHTTAISVSIRESHHRTARFPSFHESRRPNEHALQKLDIGESFWCVTCTQWKD